MLIFGRRKKPKLEIHFLIKLDVLSHFLMLFDLSDPSNHNTMITEFVLVY